MARAPASRLAVVVVSHDSAGWLPACLGSLRARDGGAAADVIVVDSGSTDDTREVVASSPGVRLVACENRGFAHANNRGLEATDAEWALLLNPDTEVVEGTLADLLEAVDRHPDAAVVGVRHVGADGELQASARRCPRPRRMLLDALAAEQWPILGKRGGERILDPRAYVGPMPCDWVSGAAMAVRTAAVRAVGGLDERFFLFCEEPDLSLRLARDGWSTVYDPAVTVVHHGGTESSSPRLAAQFAISQRLYLAKHFGPVGRALGIGALTVGFGLRALLGDRHRTDGRRASALSALRALHRLSPPPFG